MIKVGITGGIGSGKSVVSEVFRLYNVPVYDADTKAKQLNDTLPEIREKLSAHFGSHLYAKGRLDKAAFANIIFHNPSQLKAANAIIHPYLLNDFAAWAEAYQHQPLVAMDAAVLFEAGFANIFDKVISVFAPKKLRVDRAVLRDRVSRKAIETRMNKQMPEKEKIEQSDFVILNDGTCSLLKQVNEILNSLHSLLHFCEND